MSLRMRCCSTGFPLNGLTSLASQGWERLFHQGETLMRQGARADLMYVIVQGQAIRIAELGPGETAGEMGLPDSEPRTATVVALEDTYALEPATETLTAVLLQFPEVARSLLHILSARIRSTDELIMETVRREKEVADK